VLSRHQIMWNLSQVINIVFYLLYLNIRKEEGTLHVFSFVWINENFKSSPDAHHSYNIRQIYKVKSSLYVLRSMWRNKGVVTVRFPFLAYIQIDIEFFLQYKRLCRKSEYYSIWKTTSSIQYRCQPRLHPRFYYFYTFVFYFYAIY
jgi:hypothetical protein